MNNTSHPETTPRDTETAMAAHGILMRMSESLRVSPATRPMNGHAISFGPYRLLAAQRLLLEGDQPVRLGSRAFDILEALVERAGEVVGKEQLIARAWPQTFVEESNLKIQMSALRRALGDGQGGNRYVITVPGRGYNFVAPVRREEPSRTPLPPTVASAVSHNLPFAATRMIGREKAVAALVARLSLQRLMTIVGPGGIGKTTVALAVAERMIANYEHGVWQVDLAPLGDPRLVPSAVATVLGLEIRTEDPLPGLVAALRHRRVLLLLDNCEHVIEAVASLATAVLSGAPGVSILATSREPLGVTGEYEYRIAPLSSPQPSSRLTVAEAEAFPAVQLFVERVTAMVEDFALSDENAALVGDICRRLDGLPLAIEFAAPRVEVLGVEGLAARLDDSLQLLGTRRRTAMPRQRTMRAVVDWSYGLLAEDEQGFLRSLGIFAGGFTVEAAAAVVPDAAKTGIDAIDHLADLVSKSLVVADVSGASPRFRLLDTTRAYAIEKLDAGGERERLARRHAEYHRNLFERAEGEAAMRPTGEWAAAYAREIDNLRAALDWAFSPGGDESIGVALTVAAIPLWMCLSLAEECRGRAEQALAALESGNAKNPERQMKLRAAFAHSLAWTRITVPEVARAYSQLLKTAEKLDDVDYRLLALGGLWFSHMTTGQHRRALAFAQEFSALLLRQNEPADLITAQCMIGVSNHLVGDQTSARQHIERGLSGAIGPIRNSHSGPFLVEPLLMARVSLARIQWLQGFPATAMHTTELITNDAAVSSRAVSLCYVLAVAACPIALWNGDLDRAERFTAMLLDQSARHGLPFWRSVGKRHQGALSVKRGDLEDGLRLLGAGAANVVFRSGLLFLGEMALAFGRASKIADAFAVITEAIDRCESTEELWIMAELQRIKGELILLQAAPGEAEAEAENHFRKALDRSHCEGCLSWELRAATSLARLLRQQSRHADAIACLRPVYGRFTEGFGTADLIAAKQLLDGLSGAGRH
jgi:predicted ATPase/DNA-binding winged helix-turn-helix (wHTH) protein